MAKTKLIVLLVALAPAFASARDGVKEWKRVPMDASRTGVTVPTVSDIDKALGTVKGRKYTAPNGKVYKGGSAGRTASILASVQPVMAPVKEVIAYSPEAMAKKYPESALTNWFIDNLMEAVSEVSGKKMDIGIGNFGGVRVDMPQGDVLVDDIRSMFPFKNDIAYVVMTGSAVRSILERMAAGRFQILGGVRVVAEKGRLVSVEVGGEPLDDMKTYNVATISFLLNGGDGLYLERPALFKAVYGLDIYEAMMGRILENTDENGRPVITGKTDGRITIIK